MIQFYAPDIERLPFLPEEESGHCCRVLRMKAGEEIRVTDGLGNIFLCEIVDAHPKHTALKIKEKKSESGKEYSLTIAVAPTKNADRIEWMVEKVMEIGVDRLVLLKCQRSERKNLRVDRLRRILISAMNQSLSSRLPLIEEMVSFRDFVENSDPRSQKFFGYCSSDYPKREFVKECRAGEDTIVMIGPEGDFTREEVALAMEKGFLPVTFGEKRLRTETAGVFAACAVEIINQL
ncbi:MAG: 16S rRNA (uracil(1498)-N(3))-methyltransferase [Muribaculaceae bacterium]|nr:16S rRNA (uracil(1498)-N(3))-methyltransferase [Muribaculaceae bacterium]